MQGLKAAAAAAAIVAALSTAPAIAQTTQFMVSGAPVTVGAQPASEGKGFSVYYYRQRGAREVRQSHLQLRGWRPTGIDELR